jgi:hypothetical protein
VNTTQSSFYLLPLHLHLHLHHHLLLLCPIGRN